MDNVLEDVLGNHKGMQYSTRISMELLDTGEWHVKQYIHQKVTDDLETWDEKEVEFESKNRRLDKAIADALILSSLYLESINYDLFSVEPELEEGEYLL